MSTITNILMLMVYYRCKSNFGTIGSLTLSLFLAGKGNTFRNIQNTGR